MTPNPIRGNRYSPRLAFSPLAKIIVVTSFLNWSQQGSGGALHCYGFESIVYTKKETTPEGVVSFLVDDIGLEPMTFRTSSGCSSQLS